jgi:5'-nucleotidase
VVSGINGGLNAGINVLYSGTVAAAIEGAFFGITSIAVSLEYDEHARFDRAAKLAVEVVEQILRHNAGASRLFNVNIPTAALEREARVRVVPMDVVRWGDQFEERIDPRGRRYYWATGGPPAPRDGTETDLTVLAEGDITITPLHFDMTERSHVGTMRGWEFRLSRL